MKKKMSFVCSYEVAFCFALNCEVHGSFILFFVAFSEGDRALDSSLAHTIQTSR